MTGKPDPMWEALHHRAPAGPVREPASDAERRAVELLLAGAVLEEIRQALGAPTVQAAVRIVLEIAPAEWY